MCAEILHDEEGNRQSDEAHPASLPDDALLTTAALAKWLGRSASNLEVCRSRGRGFSFIKLPDGGIRYRVGAIRAALAALDEYTGTHQYAVYTKAGPGRPKRKEKGKEGAA